MKKIINLSLFAAIVVLALHSQGAHAWVQKISLERVFVGDNIRIHEVAIRCRIQKKQRIMRKRVSSNGPWCSIDIPNLCARSKVSAARQLCKLSASEFAAMANGEVEKPVVADATKESKSSVTAELTEAEQERDSKQDLLSEQMLIEEQRIEIAQRRIELTRREVGLKKKLSEMASATRRIN